MNSAAPCCRFKSFPTSIDHELCRTTLQIQVFPYIDPHLIDRNGSSWAAGDIKAAVCSRAKQLFGGREQQPYEERWGTEHRTLAQELVAGPSFSVIANPACALWQRTIGELVGKLVREEGMVLGLEHVLVLEDMLSDPTYSGFSTS
jgi:hypothetical protein